MKTKAILTIGVLTASLAVVGVGTLHAQSKDKYGLKVPGGLASRSSRDTRAGKSFP